MPTWIVVVSSRKVESSRKIGVCHEHTVNTAQSIGWQIADGKRQGLIDNA
jgi:hypothetical protein